MPRLTAAGFGMLGNRFYESRAEGGSRMTSLLFLRMNVEIPVEGILLSLTHTVASLPSILLHPVMPTSVNSFDPYGTVITAGTRI